MIRNPQRQAGIKLNFTALARSTSSVRALRNFLLDSSVDFIDASQRSLRVVGHVQQRSTN